MQQLCALPLQSDVKELQLVFISKSQHYMIHLD